MKENTRPLLTIGIIFKNEIRCLKRCLEALTPLREAVPCELIMADTGSSDGSRKIAMQYADLLFDFPWIKDFSAARNAVMDRASGQWYLTVDADEYLDGDVSELSRFLLHSGKQTEPVCGVVQRNYDTLEMDSKYSDFLAVRLVRMSTGLRYQGAVHEAWPFEEMGIKDIRALSGTILHHDGYAGMDKEEGRGKRERNLELLQKLLAGNPKDLKALMQYIESGRREEDYLEVLRRALTAVEAKEPTWKLFGPPIFRYAVKAALEEELAEFWSWVSRAERLFPDSYYTRIDIEYIAFTRTLKEGDLASAIRRGEGCLKAIQAFRKDKESLSETMFSTVMLYSPYWEQGLKIYLADLYIKMGTPERARELLLDIDSTLLDVQQTGNLLCVLGDLHRLSRLDTAPMIQRCFEGIKKSVPSEETARKREDMFFQTAKLAFLNQTRIEEQQEQNFCRPSHMLFLPLINECDIGRGAAVMALQNPEEIRLVLSQVEDWEQFPIEALSHALKMGVSFPIPEKSLKSEEMERLAVRLSESMEDYISWLLELAEKNFGSNNQSDNQQSSLQVLAWMQHLFLIAVRTFDWKAEKTDKGLRLAIFFAKIENKYLIHFYAPGLLCPENLQLLPALHRFGWYCAKAFDVLDSGDVPAYIRELKAGLKSCPEANALVEYLTEYTPQLNITQQNVSKELLELAEQVRILLALYPPNHPAVTAIKASEAYQKVAEIIENNGL